MKGDRAWREQRQKIDKRTIRWSLSVKHSLEIALHIRLNYAV